ncbi:MAG: universal stress protein, partial [Hyphomicrobiales bacterium]|nr:universal stress protein [Hyphomicrobiales bacterium]
MFKNILVPVDISEVDVAKPGFDEAAELAKLGGGVLRLNHVRSPVPYAM